MAVSMEAERSAVFEEEENIIVEKIRKEEVPPLTRRAEKLLGEYNYIRLYDVPFIRILIIGKEGSGKTNTGYDVWKEVRRVGYNKKLTSIYFQFHWKGVKEFFDAVGDIDSDWAFIFIDDFSFALDMRTREARKLLNKLSKIRHLNKRVKKWFLQIATHYSKATVPFLRQANIILLTSLTTFGEFMALREFYREHTLKRYWRMYRKRPWLYPVLVNSWGLEWITRPPLYRKKKWNIEIIDTGEDLEEEEG